MRTNLDFTARSSALVASGCNSLSLFSALRAGTAPAATAILSAGLLRLWLRRSPSLEELSVSHGKDYLESAAACKRLSDKRPHTQPMEMPGRVESSGRADAGNETSRRRPPMTTKSAPINEAANLGMPTRQFGEMLLCYASADAENMGGREGQSKVVACLGWPPPPPPNTMRATRAEAEALCQLCSFQPKYQLLLATDKAVFLSLSHSLSLSHTYNARLTQIQRNLKVAFRFYAFALFNVQPDINFCLLCESGSDCVRNTLAHIVSKHKKYMYLLMEHL